MKTKTLIPGPRTAAIIIFFIVILFFLLNQIITKNL